MNYSQLGSQIRQSDQIMRKLDEIKNAIQGKHENSPTNLHHYLPQERINSNFKPKQRLQNTSNPQSYRQSLEKKLQNLFKQERKLYSDFQEQRGQEYQLANLNNNSISQLKFDRKDAFTIEKMEKKIKQLEKKYLYSQPTSQQKLRKKRIQKDNRNQQIQMKVKDIKNQKQQENSGITPKKTKSFYGKHQTNKKKNKSIIDQQIICNKSDHRLIEEIGLLKKQVRQIRQSNIELNEKLEYKQKERNYKKERSRYLLRSILEKLIDIQQEVRRRDISQEKKTNKKDFRIKTPAQQRQSLKNENTLLIRQVEELNQQLKKQVSEKERAQQKSHWIQTQLKKLNKI